MTQNTYAGDVPLEYGEQELTLRYDWAALARVHEAVGVDALSNLLRASPLDLAEVVAAGLAAHHPDKATAQAVMALGIPLAVAAQAAARAVGVAYFGPSGPPEAQADEAGEPAQGGAPDEGKKTP